VQVSQWIFSSVVVSIIVCINCLSFQTSNGIKFVENAEVAEIKRAVFRALTRLRAASINEFDTIARLETQAIDAYNDAHHYRAENPLTPLHNDEAPVETDKLKSFH
jgi:hypothetical protein